MPARIVSNGEVVFDSFDRHRRKVEKLREQRERLVTEWRTAAYGTEIERALWRTLENVEQELRVAVDANPRMLVNE